MSTADVDELFGEGGRRARPRSLRVGVVLAVGLVLAILGMACTAVPGGLVCLVAWALVEREIDRVDSGYLALDYRPGLVTLRALVWASLVVVLGLFIVQGFLLCTGFYTTMWTEALDLLRVVLLPEAVEPVPPTP